METSRTCTTKMSCYLCNAKFLFEHSEDIESSELSDSLLCPECVEEYDRTQELEQDEEFDYQDEEPCY